MFQSIWHILTCLCVPPAIFAYTSSPCTSIPMFGVLTWLLGLTWSRLPAPTGESRVFDAFRLVLIVSFRFCSSVRAVANDCHVPVPSWRVRPTFKTIRYLYVASHFPAFQVDLASGLSPLPSKVRVGVWIPASWPVLSITLFPATSLKVTTMLVAIDAGGCAAESQSQRRAWK